MKGKAYVRCFCIRMNPPPDAFKEFDDIVHDRLKDLIQEFLPAEPEKAYSGKRKDVYQ